MSKDRSKPDESSVDVRERPAADGGQQSDATRAVNELGPKLVHYLFSASKTVQVHDLNNRATQRVLVELTEALHELGKAADRISLRIAADFLLINDVRVTVDPQSYGPFLFLIDEMKKRNVEGIGFQPDIDARNVGRFLNFFFSDQTAGATCDALLEGMATQGIEGVALVQWVERERKLEKTVEAETGIKEESNQVFFRGVALMGEVLKGIEQRRVLQVRKAERLIQQMADIIDVDESILVGLVSIKDFDEYTFAHSVNVCILSMLIGDRLSLPKEDVAHLGVAALLHDIGKTYIPQNILNNPGKLSDEDWETMKYHTFFGVKEISRIKALREIEDALFVALQHHIHLNMNGYPHKAGGWDLRLFSRIVTIADYYDAMTTPRVYTKEPLTPDKALSFILQKSGEIFDPFIAKVFIKAMGAYPVGSVVELDTGEVGVVVRQNRAGRFIHRPQVVLFGGEDGATETAVDLSEWSDDDERYRRSIVKTLYRDQTELQKVNVFLTDAAPKQGEGEE